MPSTEGISLCGAPFEKRVQYTHGHGPYSYQLAPDIGVDVQVEHYVREFHFLV